MDNIDIIDDEQHSRHIPSLNQSQIKDRGIGMSIKNHSAIISSTKTKFTLMKDGLLGDSHDQNLPQVNKSSQIT